MSRITCFFTCSSNGGGVLYLSACITVANKICNVLVYTRPVYGQLSPGPTLGNTKVASMETSQVFVLQWLGLLFLSHSWWHHQQCLNSILCIQKACRSGSISVHWSGHPVWTTLANQCQVFTGFTFDVIDLALLKHADSSDGDVYSLIFPCKFSLYITALTVCYWYTVMFHINGIKFVLSHLQQ